ncbi:MAG: hypothetical protein E6J02_03765 [Chloroflexi bacterium]|nr:MAG: hypothetical protein E6J02_03765 [Chloroflexota bacterium]TME13857.1 MAG: hypothetical protein E6I63_14415 [Chloroflexota bacterium]
MREVRVDLHGYDVKTATDLAFDKVREAYRNGYERVELLHGAADVSEPVESGRGRIKWELREMVRRGEFDAFVERDRTWLKAGSIVLYLKRNPQASREQWGKEPPKRYR